MAQPYEIVSVRRAKPPPGAEGSIWQHYVIAFEGSNSIHGYRQGNRKAVTSAVEDIVGKLNERHKVPKYAVRKRGRVQLLLKKKTRK
ncbi:MAG: hypothetical protein ACE5FE_02380 [Acidiferrobacterales bacterium]